MRTFGTRPFRTHTFGMCRFDLGRSAIATLLALVIAQPAWPQAYPSHPITMIVPFAAGGPADVVARVLARYLGKQQPIVVENVGGAGGNIGSLKAAHSAPDGYTLLSHNISMAISPSLYTKLDYDPLNDFDDIGLVAYQPNVVLARPGLPAKTFAEFTAYLRANQGKLTFANTGPGGASYLCAVLVMNALKVDITSVSYRSTSQAMTDLLGGQVDLLCDSVATATSYINAGTLQAFGVSSKDRFSGLPQVPSLAEQGLAGFDMVNWTALYAPKHTPAPVLATLRGLLRDAVSNPDFKTSLERIGSSPVTPDRATPEALASYLAAEMTRWAAVLKNVKVPAQ